MAEAEKNGANDYKSHISGVFTRASADYDHSGPEFFSYIGRRLVDFADVGEGAHVLDLACGRGAVLFPAAESVAESGEVIGIDISEGMIRLIGGEIERSGLANATAVLMDAENLDFTDGSFDTVLCGLGLFFFPDLEGSLAEIVRVLKPGGLLAVSTFETVEDEIAEHWEALNAAFKEHITPLPDAETTELDSEDEVREVFSKAGFIDIEVTRDQQAILFSDADEWWRWMWSHGFRSFLERMDSAYLDDYKEQATRLFIEQKEGQAVPETWNLLFSKARKASAERR